METYILPAYWASALINDDQSGMSEDEIKALNEWRNKSQAGWCAGCSDEQYFKWSNDATNLGGDVLEFYFKKEIGF